MGITGLNRSLEWYGPAITLGGGEVKLLDLTNAYATLDNLGGYIPSQAILRVNDSRGNVLFDYQAPAPKPALDPRAAFMVTSILTDTKAREPAFGVHNPLVLSRPAAAKTGTTNDFRDNWTLGYTPGLVVGVWVGNPDNAEMKHSTGITGAAPIWHDVMEAAYADHSLEDTLQIQGHSPPDQFAPPPGLVKARVCQPTPGGSCQVNEDWVYAEQAKALGDSSVNYQLGKVSLVELSSSTGNNQSSGYCRTSSHLKVPADQVITLDVAKVVSRRSGSVSLWDGNDRLPRIYKFLVGENEDLRVRVRVGRRIEDRAMYTFYPYNDSVNVRNLPECTPELLAGAVVPTPIVAATDTAIDGTVDESTPEPIITLEPEPTIQPTATPPPPPPPPIEQATGGIITFPGPGQVLHGGAAVQGRVQFSAAEYKFYKLEIAPAGSNNFVTLGDVHPNPVTGQLEWLAANALPPGDYILRLVLVRQDGNWIVTSQVQFTIAR
jgi:hypothetical protein